MQKLPVWRTVVAAYGFVFGRPAVFFRAAWPWFVLLLAIFAASLFGHASNSPALSLSHSQRVLTAFALTLGFYVVAVGFFISVSVAIHRAIILKEVSWRAPLRGGRRQWRFLGVGILIALAMAVPFFVLGGIFLPVLLAFLRDAYFSGSRFLAAWLAITGVFGWAVSLIVWGIGSNMMIALPSVAIDEPGGAISRALQRGQGNGWRLYLGSLLCCAPFFMLQLAIELQAFASITGWSLTGEVDARVIYRPNELVENISFLAYLLEAALLVAYYSYAFRELTDATAMPESAQQPHGAPAQ